jgi:choline dehydrogenase
VDSWQIQCEITRLRKCGDREIRGTVHILSINPAEAPAIHPIYLSAQSDRIVAVESVRLTRRTIEQPKMARFVPIEFRPGPLAQTDENIVRTVGDKSAGVRRP